MAVNADKISRWKSDVAASVDMYNEWFIEFAPKAYRDTRIKTTGDVENALKWKVLIGFGSIALMILRSLMCDDNNN